MRALVLLLAFAAPALAQDAATLSTAATPAFAPGTHGDPFDDTGLSQGCVDEGGVTVCTITSRGANLIARSDSSPAAPITVLQSLPGNTAVALTGDITSYGDITAEIVLSTVETGEADPHAGTLSAMQGAWVSVDDPAFGLEFAGTEQIETHAGEVQGYYLVSIEDQCPGGPDRVGPVLYALLMGGDPETDATCHAILAADGAVLEMSLIGGTGGTLRFVRP